MLGLGLSGLILAGIGCAHTRRGDYLVEGSEMAPAVPVFLNGPMGVLLTNGAGFSAYVELVNPALSNSMALATGQLLVRHDHLLFAPESRAGKGKAGPTQVSYVWNVGSHQGFVLHESLQGYAPVSSNVRFTNVVSQPGNLPPADQVIEGHRCQAQQMTVTSADGAPTTFQVWRAAEFNGLVVRIDTDSLSLRLFKIRLEVPPRELFQPPDGFTKYPNLPAMVSELAQRQANLSRRSPAVGDQTSPDTPGAVRRYGTPGLYY